MSPKVSLESQVQLLLFESTREFKETKNLEWEWDHFIKINSLLKIIRQKEASRDLNDELSGLNISSNSKREEKIKPFLSWLSSNGIDTSRLTISPTPKFNGLGLMTRSSIQANEIVFKIPEKIMLKSELALESKLKILAQRDPLLKSMPNILLTLLLIYEKYVRKEESFWREYIDILPTEYDTVLYFSDEDMGILRLVPSAFRESLKMLKNIARQYSYFFTVFGKSTDSGSRALKKVFTFSRYAWAASTIMTRENNLVRAEGQEVEYCLIPLWDLCNHDSSGVFSNEYHPSQGELVCWASRNYGPNEEFLIYYGQRTSTENFVHGAFVPPTFEADFFTLQLGLSPHDAEFSRKEKVLSLLGLSPVQSFRLKAYSIHDFRNIFIFVSIQLAKSGDMDRIESQTQNPDSLAIGTPEIWNFLVTRFSLLCKASERTEEILKTKINGVNRGTMILRLVENETNLLRLLLKETTKKLESY